MSRHQRSAGCSRHKQRAGPRLLTLARRAAGPAARDQGAQRRCRGPRVRGRGRPGARPVGGPGDGARRWHSFTHTAVSLPPVTCVAEPCVLGGEYLPSCSGSLSPLERLFPKVISASGSPGGCAAWPRCLGARAARDSVGGLLGSVRPRPFLWEPVQLRQPPRLCQAHRRGQKRATAAPTGLSLLVMCSGRNRHPCRRVFPRAV